jgi:peptidoglycan/LPS O-acetylase OafA/YrhL
LLHGGRRFAQPGTPAHKALLFVAASLTLTLLLSAAMYRWYEKPTLRLRDRVTRNSP